MRRAMERTAVFMGLILVLGCRETRYPSCMPRSSGVEAKSYDIHDPFPDEEIGPKTFSRPPTFQVPRSDTRKTFDLRSLQASRGLIQPGQDFQFAGVPTGNAAPIVSDVSMWDETAPRYNVVPH